MGRQLRRRQQQQSAPPAPTETNRRRQPASPTISTTAGRDRRYRQRRRADRLGHAAAGYNETGTITFTLYAPNGTSVVDTETVTVSGNGTYSTPTVICPRPPALTNGSPATAATATTTRWPAPRRSEPETVSAASPTISTTPERRSSLWAATSQADRLGHAVGRLQRDRHDHLHAVRPGGTTL